MLSTKKKILLTFDVEDFINEESIVSLFRILKLLEKHRLKGLFFISGSAAEKLCTFHEIVKMLKAHEIGYHSSSHSVKPRIFEYTDVREYKEAVEISKARETSHVDPLTGEIKGEGGILFLRRMFQDKNICSFRAPMFCWATPHLEAMRELGIKFDFSTDLSRVPVWFKGITFYPYPIMIDSIIAQLGYLSIEKSYYHDVFSVFRLRLLIARILKEDYTVLLLHPAGLYFKAWDHFYLQKTVPEKIVPSIPSSFIRVETRFKMLELLFVLISFLNKIGVIEFGYPLEESSKPLDTEETDVERIYSLSVRGWIEIFGYKPTYLNHHFHKFFEKSE